MPLNILTLYCLEVNVKFIFFILIVVFLIVVFFLPCSPSIGTNMGDRFQVVHHQGSDIGCEVTVLRDSQTGIDYLLVKRGLIWEP